MKNLLTLLVSIGFVLATFGQITNAEYFIDTDPGVGNGTTITVTSGNIIDKTFTIPTAALPNGLHVLHIRVKGTNNTWSLYHRSYFFIQPPNTTLVPTNIVAAEYFIDADPGTGSGINIPISAGMTIDQSFTLPTAGLPNGLHILHIRVKETNNTWSLYHRAYFYINPSNTNLNPPNLVAAEFFIDNDPGAGAATPLAITNGMTVDQVFNIPTGALPNGIHVLHMRVKDADNIWSLYHRAYFFVYDSNTNTNPTPIVDAEYFLDTDPGVGNGIAIPVTNGFDVVEIFSAPIPLAFADGDHYLHVRVKDQDDTWSLYKRKLFVVDASVGNPACSGITKTWSGVWDGDGNPPTVDDMVIINANYNTNVDGNIDACSCTINIGNKVTVYADEYVSLTNNLVNNGEIEIKNNGSFAQFNPTANVLGAGNFIVERTTNNYLQYDYTYWSSPSTNNLIADVFTANNPNFIYDFNTANFEDLYSGSYPQNSGNPDTFDDNNDDWNLVSGVTTMTAGKGYIVQGSGTLPTNNIETKIFNNAFNSGVISIPVTLDANQNDPSDNDNLIGNPYPSSIDAIAFMVKNPILSGTLYYWTHNSQLSNGNPGPDAENFTNNDYSTWVAAGGVQANTGGQKPTDFIASCQGFFASVNANGNVLFDNTMRIKDNNGSFFRNSNTNEIDYPNLEGNRIWLNLTNQEDLFRQVLIGFYDEATDGHDRYFDGKRLFSGNNYDFSSLNQNTQYAIQGLPNYTNEKIIPLSIKAPESGMLTISIDELDDFFNTQDIYIIDHLTQITHNLKESNYTFNIMEGEFNNRLELLFKNNALAINSPNLMLDKLVVTNNSETSIKIKMIKGTIIKDFKVYDVLGKLIINTKPNNSNFILQTPNIKSGTILFIKVKLETGQLINYKFLKN